VVEANLLIPASEFELSAWLRTEPIDTVPRLRWSWNQHRRSDSSCWCRLWRLGVRWIGPNALSSWTYRKRPGAREGSIPSSIL